MANFHWVPDYVLEEQTGYAVEITEYESGKEQRRRKHLKPRRSWILNFAAITETQVTDMETFFKARKGSHDTFTWTCLTDNIQYTVRFLDDIFQYNRITDDVYESQIRLVEIVS